MNKIIKLFMVMFVGIFILSGCGKSSVTENKGKNLMDNNNLKVTYVDVNNGDATLIQYNNKTMLIDSGREKFVGKLVDYLNSKEIKKIDYLIASNYNNASVGGMTEIIEKFDINSVYLPQVYDEYDKEDFEKIESELNKKNIKANKIVDKVIDPNIDLGDVRIEVLTPTKNENIEDKSLVMKLSYGETSFLFTGSSDKKVEAELIKEGINLKSDVLQVSNNGSDKSTSPDFVKEVNPKIAIISAGSGNENLSQRTLDNINGRNVKLYRTDVDGNILIESDGEKITQIQ